VIFIHGLHPCPTDVFRHGRDNKLHVWTRIQEPLASASIRLGGSAALPGLPIPTLCYSMDVNALNYCRFSLLLQPASAQFSESNEALIALPNLVESSLVCTADESNIVILSHLLILLQHSQADIWALPSCQRVHAAIGKDRTSSSPMDVLSSDGRGNTKTGADFSQAYFLNQVVYFSV
jgi:ASTRA-associated protein 1